MRQFLVCLLFALLAPLTTAQTIDMAGTVILWKFNGIQSFEEQEPGLGDAERYTSSAGWIDIYRYDMNRVWQEGTDDPDFDAHFDGTIADIQTAVRKGYYSNLIVGPRRDLTIAGQPFRTVSFTMTVRGVRTDSRTYLTGHNDKLLKYRMSFKQPIPDGLDRNILEFIARTMNHPATTLQ